jgi:hypothetical protein
MAEFVNEDDEIEGNENHGDEQGDVENLGEIRHGTAGRLANE